MNRNKWFYIPCLLLCMAFTLGKDSNGIWQVLKTTNKAAARSENGFAAVNGKLYLIGGDGPVMPVEVLDPKTLTWAKKAMAPVVMHHFQAVALNNNIYILDAFSDGSFPDQTPMSNVYSYNTQTDTWEKGGVLAAQRRRAGAGAAAYKGKLYLVAGITHGHSSGTNGMFDEYDPATQKWKALPDAPHIRDHAQAVVINDKLYAIGGRNTSYHDDKNFMSFFSKTVLDVDCYDFKTNKWTTLGARLPLGTGGGTAVNLDGRIYYTGGERATDTKANGPQRETYYYDTAKPGAWVQTADLDLARNGVGGTVLDHKIYIAGGSGGGAGQPPNGNTRPGGPPPNGNPGGPPPNNGKAPSPPPGNRPPGGMGDITVEVFTYNKAGKF